MSAAIRLDGLTKRFGERMALDAISATIPGGGITGLVGPDGAGKSTLLRLLAGLLVPEAGQSRVLGLDPVQEGDALRQRLGYMPQQFGLYEDLSVLENLTLYADLRGVVEPERSPTFARLLAFTDLARFTTRPAGKLSGGMKQKLGLACALLGQPEVLLLDEPGVGVDPISRRALWKMVRELAQGGMTVLWSTAYLDEAELCDHVLLMAEGAVRTSGTPADLMGAMASRCWLLEAGNLDGRALADAALTAPSDGIILTRAVETGSMVQAGATAFNLSLTTPVWVRAYVEEPWLGHFPSGARVQLTTDSRPDKPYQGVVGFVSPSAEFTPKSVETPDLRTHLVYRLRIVVQDPDPALRQGMPVTVRLAP